jgi:hypothetical protein
MTAVGDCSHHALLILSGHSSSKLKEILPESYGFAIALLHFEQTNKWIYVYERKSAIIDQDNKEQSSVTAILPCNRTTGRPGCCHCRNGSQSALESSEAIYTPPSFHPPSFWLPCSCTLHRNVLSTKGDKQIKPKFLKHRIHVHADVIIGVLVLFYSQHLLECFLVTPNILSAIL